MFLLCYLKIDNLSNEKDKQRIFILNCFKSLLEWLKMNKTSKLLIKSKSLYFIMIYFLVCL